jgi:hypothetical protein
LNGANERDDELNLDRARAHGATTSGANEVAQRKAIE